MQNESAALPQPTMPPKLAKALADAQRSANAVEKDGKNDFHKYRYASAESMIQEGRTALGTVFLSLMQAGATIGNKQIGPDPVKGDGVTLVTITLVTIAYVLSHESGEAWSFTREWPVILEKGRPWDKAYGGALTTALSYTIRDLLLIPRDDDYAAMDRRRDDDEPPRREPEPRREPPRDERREPEPEARREPESAPARRGEETPQSVYEGIFADIQDQREVQTIPARIADASLLTPESRASLRYLADAYQATNEQQIGRVGADVRADKSLSKAWVDATLDRMVEAWERVSRRAA